MGMMFGPLAFAQPQLILGTTRPAMVGDVFKKVRTPTEFADRFTRVEEAFVRVGQLDRQTAIYALNERDRPCMNHMGAPEKYVYRIRPIGEVLRCDFGWFHQALNVHSFAKAKALADKYYRGEIHPKHAQVLSPRTDWKQITSGRPRNPRQPIRSADGKPCSGEYFWEYLCERVEIVKRVR